MLPKNFTPEEQPDGSVIVRGVPIFAECSKQGFNFGDEWISLAVGYHRAQESNGNVSPMVVQHFDNAEGIEVTPAGAWTNTRKGMIRTKAGKSVPGIIADLVFTDMKAWARAKANQLLWRSPEIPMRAATGEDEPHFKVLSLLDRHRPHNDDLPAMAFSEGSVRFRKYNPEADQVAGAAAGAVVAFAEGQDSIAFLMEPEAMPDEDKKTEDEEVKMADGEDTPKKDSEGGDDTKGGGWKSALDALKSCDIPIEDIPEVKTAIEEFASGLGGDAAPEEVVEEVPDPTDVIEDGPADPTELPMSDDARVIALASDNEILKKRLDAMDADKAKDAAVEAAFDQVKDRGFTRDDMIRFADEHGPAALEGHAKAIVEKVMVRDATFDEVISRAEAAQKVPDEVLKFQSEGPDAYEWAQRQAQIHGDAVSSGTTGLSLGRWLEVNKPGGDFVRGPTGTEV